MIVSQPIEPLWAFINARVGVPWSSDFRAIGVVRNDCLAAVVAYNGFTGRTCFMHDAIDDPTVIDRTFVREIFKYPFEQCGVKYILAMVDSANERALSINRRIGFKEILRLDGAGLEGPDMILLQLDAASCRYLRNPRNDSPKAARHSVEAGVPG